MTKRMLIDATHEEETRVAVIENGHLIDFDYESKYRKPLKGNVFLAKVTRVEPSLQAAFVNFGGNRHGFLPFSEIHPDYFRIPVADREALMAEQEDAIREAEEREAREAEEDAAREASAEKGGHSGAKDEKSGAEDSEEEQNDENETLEDDVSEGDQDNESDSEESEDDDDAGEEEDSDEKDGDGNTKSKNSRRRQYGRRRRGSAGGGENGNRRPKRGRRVEKYEDEETRFRFNLRRRYKIQEVIKRGQIMLVQVNKEERGNKGAAVGSYLSLPGRYCVLMPNSPRAGGISRKIANYKDRNRMREIIRELEVPKGMSVILRTAGVSRTKSEIKRDLDYLIRLWNQIREDTLQATAPSMIYEEADLIKRSVRDLYTRDVEDIQVAGEDAYKNARTFMKMMIPSHAKRVKLYENENKPLFHKYDVEHQIAKIGETQVRLPAGGYLVINPTEALVSIDVNSGKATKERHIEETALRTNLEAAEEVARQLRLRDLGGLVVIDFIDMEDRRNNGKVERKMRDALSGDRARVQVGRISNFGLMELSRQRMNPSLTESQYELCEHCSGTGRVRTADATSVMVLRAIEQEGLRKRAAEVIVHVPGNVALYILNYKRKALGDLENRFSFRVLIRVDDSVTATNFRVEVSKPIDDDKDGDQEKERDQDDSESDTTDTAQEKGDNEKNRSSDDQKKSGRRRSRRGGRNRNDRSKEGNQQDETSSDEQKKKTGDDVAEEKAEKEKRKPSRGRRSSKDDKQGEPEENNKSTKDNKEGDSSKSESKSKPKPKPKVKPDPKADEQAAEPKEEKKKPVRARRKSTKESAKKDDDKSAKDEKSSAKPEKSETGKSEKPAVSNDDGKSPPKKDEKPEKKDYEVINEAPENKKKGWWNKLSG